MGGKGGKKKGLNATPGCQPRVSMTLREESSGKKQGNVNAKTMCKLDHLKNLAVWSAAEASVPSLGAFFGERLAATTEALGLRADPSLFVCERCESILQPGHNCTVRIEKNKSKMRHRRKKPNLTTQNNVVYRCHFCSHRNLMRGTPKGYVKEICPPKAKPPSKLEHAKSVVEKRPSLAKAATSITEVNTVDTFALPTVDGPILEASCPATPLPTTGLSLLDSKKRKRNRSGVKKVAEPETSSNAADAEKSTHASSKRRKKRNRSGVKKVAEPETSSNAADAEKSTHASSKRRKKSWTSLKEIAQSSGHDISKKFTDLTLPFFI